MRFLKLALISVVVLFIVLTAISSLLPSKILVSRAVDIRGSVMTIREEVFGLHNWPHWMTDDKGQKGNSSYDPASGILTFSNTKIKRIRISDSTITTLWSSPTEMTGTFRVIDHHTADSLLTVQWQMEQRVKWYPWQKFASITKDELWGGSMEKSLDNLKTLAEVQ
jgi:hypothetical protein